ncbi:MAG TPA: exopolysaccharide biosynthesis polyprenyl glycosylphosphotransferase [Solirubrobacteraceae bacterium]|nr:exopolysaccharide biosynthesis polyprenyl glycosylphosphotransferase [Solirubrobacteraceae bacterium]
MEAISSQVEEQRASPAGFEVPIPIASGQPSQRGLARRLGGLGPILETRGPAASLLRDAIFRRMLLAGDVLAIICAFALAIELSGGRLHLAQICLAGLPLIVLGTKLFGLYDRDEAVIRKTTLDEVPKLFQVATLCALVAWLAESPLGYGRLTRADVLFLWLSLAALLIIGRCVARALALRVAPIERCLFIGSAASEQTIRSRMINHGGVRAEIVAHVDLDEIAPWSADAFSQDKLKEIRDLAGALDVHRAILAPSSSEAGEMLDLVRTLKAVGIRVSVVPRLLQVVGSSVEFDDLHGVTLMGVRRFDLTRSSALVKRSFDLVGASLGLLLLSPLMIAISIAIKLDSRGPLFFRQLRVGRDEKHFGLFKFRTMVPNAEQLKSSLADLNEAQEGLFKIADDPRVTRVGRFLRKTALDELPQLFNVLRGEMSLVGPRPLIRDEDQRIEGWHRRRLALHPGMTGHWQILGPASVSLREMVAIDYLYVANWSLWTDVKILLRTVPYVLCRRGL